MERQPRKGFIWATIAETTGRRTYDRRVRAVQIPARPEPRTNPRGCPHKRTRWRDNQELVRKHYIAGEDGAGGAFYIWPSKKAAQRGHNAEWFANIKARTGSVPTIRYFDLMMIVDNEDGLVTEFPPNVTSEAAE
jgi:hypothetical protein